MKITERRLIRLIRSVIVESGYGDDYTRDRAKITSRWGDYDEFGRSIPNDYSMDSRDPGDLASSDIDLDYVFEVLDKCFSLGYSRSFVDDDTMLLKEPIKIGKSYKDLVDIRDVLILFPEFVLCYFVFLSYLEL